jgi:DNA polymerase
MTLPLLTVDFETRSYASIKDLGSRAYALHPTTEIVCAGFAWKEGDRYETLVIHPDRPGWDLEWPFGDVGDFEALAHNHYFDARVWERVGFKNPVRWIDTSELARRAGMPSAKLEWLAKELLGAEKDMQGNALMKSLSKRKARKRKRGEPLVYEHFALDPIPADVLAGVEQYCALDALLETRLYYEHFEAWDSVSPLEDAILHADRLINNRGVCFDVELAKALLDIDRGLSTKALADAGVADSKGVAPARFVAKMAEYGVYIDNAQKTTVEPLLEHEDPRVALLAAARLGTSTIAGGKIETALDWISSDNRLRDMYVYARAHTWRWAARGPQLQNLPK